MDFLFTFLNFLQPGILWPALAEYRPLLTVALLMAVVGYFRTSLYPRAEAFRHPIFLYLSAFLGVQVLSVHYSGGRSMLSELNYWSVYIEFVIISILLINEPHALRRYVWGMIAGSMVIVFYGIYAVYAGLPSAVGGRAGAYGMYENHNDYSFIIIMALPYMYMFWKTHSGTSVRLLLGFFMLSCVAGIFLSLSRGGVLALVLEAMLIVLFAVERGKRFRYLFLIALLGTAAISYQWATRAENQGESYTAEDAEYSRIELWKAGKNMVTSHPLLGVGSRRFGEFSQEYGEISGYNKGKNSHNTYVEILSTSGFLGFIPFVLMLRKLSQGLSRSAVESWQEWLDPIRKATLISFYAILFRAIFDAKAHDWSLYVLASIAIACVMLQRSSEVAKRDKTEATVSEGAVDA